MAQRLRQRIVLVSISTALLLAARRRLRVNGTVANGRQAGLTTGRTIHWARFYDPLVALLTLGRGSALRKTTVDLAGINPGESVLDVGCGTGAVTMPAKVRSGPHGEVYGIDPAPKMIAEARRKASRAGLTIDYRVAAVEALPFPDATFDVVLSSMMMHHLPEDLKPPALTEIRRVLKADGRLLVVDLKHPTNVHDRLALMTLFHHQIPGRVDDLPALLASAGFVAVESGSTGFGPVGFVRARAG